MSTKALEKENEQLREKVREKNAVSSGMAMRALDVYVSQFLDLIHGKNKLVSERVVYK